MRHASIRRSPRPRSQSQPSRRGTVVVLTAVVMMMVMAMVAFAVDIGYIANSKAQLQNASDAAGLGAALELYTGLGPDAASPSTIALSARSAAIEVAALNPAAGSPSVSLASTDIQLGRRTWGATGGYSDSWGGTPYNLISVTTRRDDSAYSDGPVTTFFARVMGHDEVSVTADTKVVLSGAAGFRIASGESETADILPIAYDLPSWNAYLAGSGSDSYSWNGASVTSASDGIREFDLYPYGNQSLTPGNRGTVDIGGANNSTNDLKRQIVYGVNADDLSHFGGEISTADGPITLNGDTGISAGIENSLKEIIGETRSIPIFTTVTSPGNNAVFTVVKFVGVRIMYVKLTGGNKKLVVQAAPKVEPTAIPATTSESFDYVFLPPRLTQ